MAFHAFVLPAQVAIALATLLASPAFAADADRAPERTTTTFGDTGSVTFSAQARLRHAGTHGGVPAAIAVPEQAQFRGIAGADIRIGPNLRIYTEAGTGQVDRGRDTAVANFQNDASLQQLFVEVRQDRDALLLGAVLGRQEFADGPRQLLSPGDGPNLHRTWNGLRVYAQAPRYRVGAFELRATDLRAGAFDDGIRSGTLLRGANASIVVSRGQNPDTLLDPFWLHTEIPGFRLGTDTGTDRRDTFGLRLRGGNDRLRYDWTIARQAGRSLGGRRIDAWGLFAVQSLALSDAGWKPRLTSHVDIASGGGSGEDGGVLRNFHPLYASSGYLGEGRFLGLSNLALAAVGVALAPSASTTLSFEYADARRLQTDDAIYAGGMRAYAGTQGTSGRRIGGLVRMSGDWSVTTRLSLDFTVEHLDSARALGAAGFDAGTYAQLGATWRY